MLDTIKEVQTTPPAWIETHGPALVKRDVEKPEKAPRERRFREPAKAVDAILKTRCQQRHIALTFTSIGTCQLGARFAAVP
jgi:hypothetical protein